jgi:hypothetical protein
MVIILVAPTNTKYYAPRIIDSEVPALMNTICNSSERYIHTSEIHAGFTGGYSDNGEAARFVVLSSGIDWLVSIEWRG